MKHETRVGKVRDAKKTEKRQTKVGNVRLEPSRRRNVPADARHDVPPDARHDIPSETKPRTIGVLKERSLHAALKKWYAQPGDELEVPLHGFVIDIVRGDLLIEIQTRNFSALRRKLPQLLEHHRLRLVHPIAVEKWIVRVAADGETELRRRRSPRRGAFEDIFGELVHIPNLLAHPNLSLEILLVREEEIRRVRARREKPARRTRYPRDWDRHDHRLLEVIDRRVIETPDDLRAFLPAELAPQFDNRELATALGGSYRRAQTMTYCLRQLKMIQVIGKRGRAVLYSLGI